MSHRDSTCNTVYKVVNGFYPDWYLKFPTVRGSTNSNTRQINNLYVPRARTDSGARAISILGPKLWNSLPSSVVTSENIHTFKSRLSKFLLRDS